MPDEPSDDRYELLPHEEIESLKKQIESLKELDSSPKKMHVSIIELNRNISKLLDIFEEALHEIKVDEGGIMFAEKIKPVVTRLERVEKNIEAIADVLSNVIAPTLSDLHDKLNGTARKNDDIVFAEEHDLPPLPPPAP